MPHLAPPLYQLDIAELGPGICIHISFEYLLSSISSLSPLSASNMTSQRPQTLLDDYSAEPKDRAAEVVYKHAIMNLSKTNNEIIIPANVVDVIGLENLKKLQQRFSYVPHRQTGTVAYKL